MNNVFCEEHTECHTYSHHTIRQSYIAKNISVPQFHNFIDYTKAYTIYLHAVHGSLKELIGFGSSDNGITKTSLEKHY